MKKDEAIKWIENTRAISPFTRSFVIWLYDNDYKIIKRDKKQEESEKAFGEWVDGLYKDFEKVFGDVYDYEKNEWRL